ncbi:putative ABC transporter ATP-binding protein TM_0352 [Opisthocomus hoazin]|uniref:putative ABC transporter ATP-binding protein TM_0352 n=1 Tax=Opisthocomus hoazin TaxID=30419 RepID=UPI003F52F57D
MPDIHVSHISKIYHEGEENEVRALDDVNFDIEEGEFVVILGPSGAGKSTLLNILGGMDTASKGSYKINDKEVTAFKPRELTDFRRSDIGFVFQFYNLVSNLTALENVELASSVAKEPLDAKEMLEKVGLGKRLYNFPAQMSGGEQQRASIARALAKNPAFLLCDEPTGALDSKTGGSVLCLLYDVCKDMHKTVILVTHNAAIADIATRVIRIQDGKVASNKINEKPISPLDVVW